MPPPNIIVICADQHRADTIGAYGSRVCRTPVLDRLASQGTRFARCYSNNPVCAPARATIMTGCQGRRHGVLANGATCPRTLPTFADLLHRAGYQTAAVGKLHLTPHEQGPQSGPYYGFDHLEHSEDGKLGPFLDWALAHFPQYEGYYLGTLFNLPRDDAYWRGRRDLRPLVAPARAQHVAPLAISATCNWGYGHYSPLPDEAHQTTWITDRAIACVERRDPARPLLLWVGYQDPHNPFDPPARWREQYTAAGVEPIQDLAADEAPMPPHLRALRHFFGQFTEQDWRTLKALYYGSVTFMDAAIGRLLAVAERQLDMRNTIVLYTADHGEILGDHGICGKSAHHYDSCIRVPLLARWDGRWPAGRVCDDLVELADLCPTVLEAAALPRPAPMDGQSYAGWLAGGAAPAAREYAYCESFRGSPGDPTPAPLGWARTVRDRRWRCTFYPRADYGELFDLEADPHELTNRWPDPGCRAIIEERRRALLDRLILLDYPLAPQRYNV